MNSDEMLAEFESLMVQTQVDLGNAHEIMKTHQKPGPSAALFVNAAARSLLRFVEKIR